MLLAQNKKEFKNELSKKVKFCSLRDDSPLTPSINQRNLMKQFLETSLKETLKFTTT